MRSLFCPQESPVRQIRSVLHRWLQPFCPVYKNLSGGHRAADILRDILYLVMSLIFLIETVFISICARRIRSTTVSPSMSSNPSARKIYTFLLIKNSSLIDILALLPARCFIAILSFSIAFHVQKGYTKSENIIIYQGVLLWKSKENI